jgi:hypothetical protein
VAGLTGCQQGGALHAVREHDAADALEIVARAMVTVDAPPPDGFRLPGFLRDGHEPSPLVIEDLIVEDLIVEDLIVEDLVVEDLVVEDEPQIVDDPADRWDRRRKGRSDRR